MSKEMGGASSESFGAKVEEAERRLQEAAAAAEVAETRATAEIRALEADLEKERLNTAQAVEELQAKHDEELRREREAKEQAIAAAEEPPRRDRGPGRGGREAGRGGRAPRHGGRAGRRRRARLARARRRRPGCGAGRVGAPRGAAIAASAEFDVAVVGGGAAGLWTALRAAEGGGSVCLISRTPLSQSASFWAQGGLAAALEPGDSPARHAADTIAAGRGLCRPAAVRGAGRGGARARCASCASAASSSTSTRTASWRWDSRAATPGGASSTPAAARPGTRSPRSWRRWSPPRRGSRCASGPRRRRCGATASAATG